MQLCLGPSVFYSMVLKAIRCPVAHRQRLSNTFPQLLLCKNTLLRNPLFIFLGFFFLLSGYSHRNSWSYERPYWNGCLQPSWSFVCGKSVVLFAVLFLLSELWLTYYIYFLQPQIWGCFAHQQAHPVATSNNIPLFFCISYPKFVGWLYESCVTSFLVKSSSIGLYVYN